jgi:hypothetical protein
MKEKKVKMEVFGREAIITIGLDRNELFALDGEYIDTDEALTDCELDSLNHTTLMVGWTSGNKRGGAV